LKASPNTNLTQAAEVPFSDNESWDEFTPKVTLEYRPEDVLVYLTYARGFKSGGFNYPAAGGEPLDPEVLDMVELGMKGEFLDNRLRLNTAVYYYDYADLQVTRASGGLNAAATTENAADADIYGIDIEFTWLASERLTISGGANFLDTEYSEYDAVAKSFQGTPGTINVGFDASGESLLRAPDWSFFTSLAYDFTVGNAIVPLVVTYSHKSSYFFDFSIEPETAALEQDDYGLLSARLSYLSSDESWELALWGSNLTDEEYFDDVVANGAGVRGSWGAPRTYGVALAYNF